MLDPPTILQLEVTRNCNLKCIMCHKGQMPIGPDGVQKDFDRIDISDTVINQVKPIFPYLRHALMFGDGEPIMYKQFWETITELREVGRSDCSIEFICNGTLLNKNNINNCLDHRISKLGISLGGATRETHNKIRLDSDLDQIVNNIEMFNKEKAKRNTHEPYFFASIVSMNSNIHELPEFVSFCAKLNIWGVEVQKLHITHDSMWEEVVSDENEELYFRLAGEVATKEKIAFTHHPIKSGKNHRTYNTLGGYVASDPAWLKYANVSSSEGYCIRRQPWNTVYVLVDGRVFPDCHWWKSIREPELNVCGILDKSTNIIDIWNGPVYKKIRNRIIDGQLLPQCRGCGLSGGIKSEYRSSATDHINPYREHSELVQVGIENITKEQLLHKIREISDTEAQRQLYNDL